MAAVNLVHGLTLTLTLIIFNPDKKRLTIKIDLAVIGLIQTAALSFGAYFIYLERPMIQVLTDDGLHIHTYAELNRHEIKLDATLLDSKTTFKVYHDPPEDPEARFRIKFENIAKGILTTLDSFRYKSFSKVDEDELEKRLERYELIENKGCYRMQLKSIITREKLVLKSIPAL